MRYATAKDRPLMHTVSSRSGTALSVRRGENQQEDARLQRNKVIECLAWTYVSRPPRVGAASVVDRLASRDAMWPHILFPSEHRATQGPGAQAHPGASMRQPRLRRMDRHRMHLGPRAYAWNPHYRRAPRQSVEFYCGSPSGAPGGLCARGSLSPRAPSPAVSQAQARDREDACTQR